MMQTQRVSQHYRAVHLKSNEYRIQKKKFFRNDYFSKIPKFKLAGKPRAFSQKSGVHLCTIQACHKHSDLKNFFFYHGLPMHAKPTSMLQRIVKEKKGEGPNLQFRPTISKLYSSGAFAVVEAMPGRKPRSTYAKFLPRQINATFVIQKLTAFYTTLLFFLLFFFADTNEKCEHSNLNLNRSVFFFKCDSHSIG